MDSGDLCGRTVHLTMNTSISIQALWEDASPGRRAKVIPPRELSRDEIYAILMECR